MHWIYIAEIDTASLQTYLHDKSEPWWPLDNLNQNRLSKKLFGWPIKPTSLARWFLWPGAAQGPQKLWSKWCKILYSGHILAHKSQLQIVGFFYWNFCLTCHKAPRSSGLKCANIYFKDKLLQKIKKKSFAPVTNFHMFEKRKLIKYE